MRSAEERNGIEASVLAVPGVEDVVNKLGDVGLKLPDPVSERAFRGICFCETYSAKMEVVNGEEEEKRR
ncbi:MAG: hypothetical protein M3N00_02750 [Actinomycetota bacterium]|nr:hypothetical protein [Actinomycetota bacterium]